MSASVHTELIPVRNSVERFFFAWFFVLIPALYTLRLMVEYAEFSELPYALLDRVKIAAELALLIVLTFANTLFATIGPTIVSLFSNGVISGHAEGDDALSEARVTCERTLDRLLNHHARVLVATLVAIATLYYYIARMGGLAMLVPTGSLLNLLDVVLYFVPTVCYAYFVGIVVWKLSVTSLFFQSFPDRYAVVPRFWHPDGACGLLPVGDLCLRMMYVAVIPTVLSGLFLVASFAPQGLAGYLMPNRTLLFGFTPLILGIGTIGLVIGFLPLFRFHLAIIKYRHQWTWEMKALAERIIVEKARVFRLSQDLNGSPLEPAVRTVTQLESYYQANRKVRLWPVDAGLVTRIWGSVALVSGQLLAFIETVRKIS